MHPLKIKPKVWQGWRRRRRQSHDPYVSTMLRRQHKKGYLSNENENFQMKWVAEKIIHVN